VVNGRRQMTGYKQIGSMHTGDKSWYVEWEKSDARIQTDGQYAHSGIEKEVMKSWGILIPG